MANKDLPTLKDVSHIPEELLPIVHWWQDKGPKTLAYTVGTLIVIAAAFLWYERVKAGRNTAVVAMASASQAEDFETIIALETTAAPIARLDLARSLYNAEDYENALVVYTTALAELDDPAVKDIAAVGRICVLEALGRTEEALKDVTALEEAFAQAKVMHYLTAELILTKARLLCQQGDKSVAKQVLDPLFSAPENSALAKYKPQAERTAKIIDAYVKKSLFEKAANLHPATPANEARPAVPVAQTAPESAK